MRERVTFVLMVALAFVAGIHFARGAWAWLAVDMAVVVIDLAILWPVLEAGLRAQQERRRW